MYLHGLGGILMRTKPWIVIVLVCLVLTASTALARNNIRNTFFDIYPVAENTQLDDLPSNAGHCGVCHFDFDGGGPRNPYGLGIEVGLNNGLSNLEAILAIEDDDSDADGFINSRRDHRGRALRQHADLPRALDLATTPVALNVTHAELEPYLTPSGGTDTTPPVVTVNSPNGGESINAHTLLCDQLHGDRRQRHLARQHLPLRRRRSDVEAGGQERDSGTGFSWFVPNCPGDFEPDQGRGLRQSPATPGDDDSDADFTIVGRPAGFVPTTLRDVDMPGTQPHEGAVLDDPDESCAHLPRQLRPRHRALVQLAGQHDGAGGARPVLLRLHGRRRAGRAVRRATSASAATRRAAGRRAVRSTRAATC